jgi:hypothetical protein
MTENGFQTVLLRTKVGERVDYHTGHLAHDREHSVALHVIGMLAYGLQMIGAVQLGQERVIPGIYKYYLRVLRPIRQVDFDYGRKTYLETEEC